MKKLLISALITAYSATLYAADKTLKIATWLPPSHSVNSVFLPKLIAEIEKRTEGRVTAEVEYDLAAPNGLLELVEYGGADISWTYNGYFPGRFITTKLIELPGLKGDSKAASVAHWRAHEKYLHKAGEYDGVEVIGFMVHGPALLFSKNEISALSEIKGKKMRAGGGVANDVAVALGTAPVLAPASKSYEMISGGVADSTMLPADVIPAFRLYEVAPYAYEVAGGLYRGSFALFMSETALDGISEQDQKALRDYFGEALSADAGAAWDLDYQKGLDLQKEKGKVQPLSAADAQAVAEMSNSIKEAVIKEVDAKGIDGKAAYQVIVDTMQEMSKE